MSESAVLDPNVDLVGDDADLTAHYATAAETSGDRAVPPPGGYALSMPTGFVTEKNFELKVGNDGKPYLAITLDNGLKGDEASALRIEEGPFAGTLVRFGRVTTIRQKATRYDRNLVKEDGSKGGSVPIVDSEGNPKVYVDAFDLLKAFDANATQPRTRAEWMAAFEPLQGKRIPGKSSLTWEGKAEGTREQVGDKTYPKRLRAAAFREGSGKNATYKKFVELVSEVQFTRKTKDGETTINPGDTYRVYPDLRLGMRPFAR